MNSRFGRVFLRNFLIALVAATIAVPLQLVAVTGAVPEDAGDAGRETLPSAIQPQLEQLRNDPILKDAVAGVEEIIAELEQAETETYPEDIPDPFHLTSQYLWAMRADGNTGDRYHLAGTEGGLPRIIPQPDMVQAVTYDGKLAFRYKHGLHVVESIAPMVMASDDELLVLVAQDGSIFAADMVFVRRELFKAPVPLHKVGVQVTSHDLRGLQLSYVTRGFSPFPYELGEGGKLLPVEPTRRFTAGDLVLWRTGGADKQRVLLSVLARDVIVDAINNGNHLLGSLAYAIRKDKPAPVRAALTAERIQEGRKLTAGKLERYRDGASAQAEHVLQSMKVERLQNMISNDVRRNSYRDEFTYATWQRDYLVIRDQAEAVVKKLEGKFIKDMTSQKKLDTLKQQLRKGDFASSWIMLSKLYTEESKDLVIDRINSLKTLRTPEANAKLAELEGILQTHDYQRLWREPELFTDTDLSGQVLSPLRKKINRLSYKYLDSESLRSFASTTLGLGALGAAGMGLAWALRTGFGLSRIWPPNPFKVADLPPRMELGHQLDNTPYRKIRKGYRRFLTRGTIIGVALIPTVALIAHFAARGGGHDWDFRRQLMLQGMRLYGTLALPFWHYLSKALGQTTLMPSLAAGVSPFAAVNGRSTVGESIGLSFSETIHVGFQAPHAQNEESEALRRRAIAMLQQQRARAQGLGWEMAARVVLRDYLQRRGGGAEIDRDAFIAHIERSSFKDKWKKLAVGLEKEIYRLHAQGIFGDLREVHYEYVYDFLYKTKPQLLNAAHYDGVGYKATSWIDDAATATGKFLATVSTDNVNFLRLADPDDFIASMNWNVFMIDFLTSVTWEGTYGARSHVFARKVLDKDHGGIGNLLATNRFPYWNAEHTGDMLTQLWAHQVAVHGRYALVFQMLQRIEENDYRPMEELLVTGQKWTQGFWAGLLDFGENSLDLRNADYGSKYVKELFVGFTMIQTWLLWSIFGRSFIAKVPTSMVGPQSVYKYFWAVWAFAWPWIVLYSAEQLREKKSDIRNGLFTQGKVRLKKALTVADTEGLQESYDSIVAVYRDFATEPPATLVKEVRNVEHDLHVRAKDRLPAATLFPYLGLLVRMKNSDSVLAKRDIYRQLVSMIEDSQQSYTVSEAEAEQLLQFLMVTPPFPTHLNPTIGLLATTAAAILTTMWGSRFMRKTYGRSVSTWGGALPWAGAGIGMYALVWALTSKNNARRVIDFVREDVLGYPESRAKEY